jgi:hypothetical protein
MNRAIADIGRSESDCVYSVNIQDFRFAAGMDADAGGTTKAHASVAKSEKIPLNRRIFSHFTYPDLFQKNIKPSFMRIC